MILVMFDRFIFFLNIFYNIPTIMMIHSQDESRKMRFRVGRSRKIT